MTGDRKEVIYLQCSDKFLKLNVSAQTYSILAKKVAMYSPNCDETALEFQCNERSLTDVYPRVKLEKLQLQILENTTTLVSDLALCCL